MTVQQNPTDDLNLSETAEAVLYAIAENHGLVCTKDEYDALVPFLEATGGTPAKSIVRLNRQAKLDSLIVHSALVLAQHKKDPLFKKYSQAANVKRRFRALIVRKYNSAAQSVARKLLANAGKHNMVDVSNHEINAMHQQPSHSVPAVAPKPVTAAPPPAGPNIAAH